MTELSQEAIALMRYYNNISLRYRFFKTQEVFTFGTRPSLASEQQELIDNGLLARVEGTTHFCFTTLGLAFCRMLGGPDDC